MTEAFAHTHRTPKKCGDVLMNLASWQTIRAAQFAGNIPPRTAFGHVKIQCGGKGERLAYRKIIAFYGNVVMTSSETCALSSQAAG